MADKIVPDNKQDTEKDHYEETYGYPEHEVSYCYSTLKQAEEIKKNPKKMAAIKEYAKEELQEAKDAITEIADIDKMYNKKYGPQNGGEEYYSEKMPEDKKDMQES